MTNEAKILTKDELRDAMKQAILKFGMKAIMDTFEEAVDEAGDELADALAGSTEDDDNWSDLNNAVANHEEARTIIGDAAEQIEQQYE